MASSLDFAEVRLTDAEVTRLIDAVLCDEEQHEQEELERIVMWAERVKVDVILLEALFKKEIRVAWPDGSLSKDDGLIFNRRRRGDNRGDVSHSHRVPEGSRGG